MLARIYNFDEINADGYKIREVALLDGDSYTIAQAIGWAVVENPLRKAVAVVADDSAADVLADALQRLRIDSVSVYADDDTDTQQRKVDEAVNAHGRFVLIVSNGLIPCAQNTQ